jgi:hypothetical protein
MLLQYDLSSPCLPTTIEKIANHGTVLHQRKTDARSWAFYQEKREDDWQTNPKSGLLSMEKIVKTPGWSPREKAQK